MANGQGEYKIKLVSEADLKGSREMQNAIDQTTIKVKGLEEATNKALSAASGQGVTIQTSGTGLATGGEAARAARAAQLREEEKQAGLMTERTMRAEALESGLHKQRIERFKKEAEFQRQSNTIAGKAAEVATNSISALASQAIKLIGVWKTVQAAFRETIPQWAEQEKNINKLNSALVNAGTYSAAFSGKLQNLAVEMQRSSGIGQEQWLQTFTKLAQFGADNSNIISLTNAVKNAVGIYGNLGAATTAVQRAMEGQFDSFREHGIIIDQNATQAKKLSQLFQELERVGGGQLQAEMQGLSGAWKEMTANAHSLGQNIGRLISNNLQLEAVTRGASLVFEAWADITQKTSSEEGKMASATHKATRSMQEQKDLAKELQIEMEKLKEGYTQARAAVHGMQAAMDSIQNTESDTLKKRLERDIKLIESLVQRRILTEQQGMIKKAQLEQRFEAQAEQRRQAAFLRESLRKDEELAASLAHEQVLQEKIAKAKSDSKTRANENEAEQKAVNAEKEFQAEQLKKETTIEKIKELSNAVKTQGPIAGAITAAQIPGLFESLEESNRKLPLLERQAKAERNRAGATKEQVQTDKKRIEELESQLRAQQNATTGRRFEAFNSAVTARNQAGQSSVQFGLDTQIRRQELQDNLLNSQGGTPNLVLGAREMAMQNIAQQRQVVSEISSALRERDTVTAQALLAILQTQRADQATIKKLSEAIRRVEGSQANAAGRLQ